MRSHSPRRVVIRRDGEIRTPGSSFGGCCSPAELRPYRNGNRPSGVSLGRLPSYALGGLHGSRPDAQGSLKLRGRVHVPVSLYGRPECHTSKVGRSPQAIKWFLREHQKVQRTCSGGYSAWSRHSSNWCRLLGALVLRPWSWLAGA